MKVKELLSDESKWVQGNFAVNSQGHYAPSSSDEACRWCIGGAILRCYRNRHYGGNGTIHSIFNKVITKLRERGWQDGVSDWNDDGTRTFADVQALVTELDI